MFLFLSSCKQWHLEKKILYALCADSHILHFFCFLMCPQGSTQCFLLHGHKRQKSHHSARDCSVKVSAVCTSDSVPALHRRSCLKPCLYKVWVFILFHVCGCPSWCLFFIFFPNCSYNSFAIIACMYPYFRKFIIVSSQNQCRTIGSPQ